MRDGRGPAKLRVVHQEAAPLSDLPTSGFASTHADLFVNRQTASGEVYRHENDTATPLAYPRWRTVPRGSRYARTVVVKIDDRGAGGATMARVLGLRRAAFARLAGRSLDSITKTNAGLLTLTTLRPVPRTTPLGPVR